MRKQLQDYSQGYFKVAMVKGKSRVKWGTCPDLLCVGCSDSLAVVLHCLPDVDYRQSLDVAKVPRCASLKPEGEKRNTSILPQMKRITTSIYN